MNGVSLFVLFLMRAGILCTLCSKYYVSTGLCSLNFNYSAFKHSPLAFIGLTATPLNVRMKKPCSCANKKDGKNLSQHIIYYMPLNLIP